MLGTIFWGGTYIFAGNPSAETLLAELRLVRPTGLISIPLRWQQIRERCLDADVREVIGDVANLFAAQAGEDALGMCHMTGQRRVHQQRPRRQPRDRDLHSPRRGIRR